ncbi:MAG: hypothetical protein QOF29_3283, partial [bacterium]
MATLVAGGESPSEYGVARPFS